MGNKLAAVLLALLLLTGCGAKTADISAYGDIPITISGLTDEDFTVTPYQLSRLDCVFRTAAGTTAKAGSVSAYGPLLDTFLAQYGCCMADFSKIRFLCADSYVSYLKGDQLSRYEVVLAVSNGSSPLPERQQPLRLLIPGAESSKWAYSVIRIEFERKAP